MLQLEYIHIKSSLWCLNFSGFFWMPGSSIYILSKLNCFADITLIFWVKISVQKILKYFFCFSQKIGFTISWKLSAWNVKAYLLGKIRKTKGVLKGHRCHTPNAPPAPPPPPPPEKLKCKWLLPEKLACKLLMPSWTLTETNGRTGITLYALSTILAGA